jgi:hypothetical protein
MDGQLDGRFFCNVLSEDTEGEKNCLAEICQIFLE